MKTIFLHFFMLMTLISCSKLDKSEGNNGNDTPQKQPEIILNVSSSDFKTDGGTSDITFEATEAWTAEAINDRADAWCSVSPTSGYAGSSKISITATANDTPDDRFASIIIKSGNVTKTIAISQKQKNALTVTASKFEIGSDGGEVNIEVKANIDFEYFIEGDAKNWVKYVGTRALKTSSLVFSVNKNEKSERREAKIYIKKGELSETITIYQAGYKPTIVISKNEYTISSNGGSLTVDVSSNIDVSVEIPSNANWISENVKQGASTNTFYFNIAANEGYESRESTIIFYNKQNNLSEVVKIVQMQKNAIVPAKTKYDLDNKARQIQIEVGHNVDFSVKTSHNWITHIETKALAKKTLLFDIAENTTSTSREGEITISSGSLIQKIKVVQSSSNKMGLQIKYKSTDGKKIVPDTTSQNYNLTVISNEYQDGMGILTLDGYTFTIPDNIFKGWSTLKHIEIPEGIYWISENAFADCDALEYISLPKTLEHFGNRAFENCTGEIVINSNIPDVEDRRSDGPFYGAKFNKVTIGENVKKIGKNAFLGCNSITSLVLPNSIEGIGENAFSGCCNITGELTIPSGMTKINACTFRGCSNLTSVVIPSSVTEIGDSAFEDCIGITSITFSNSVTKIGDDSFCGCKGIASLDIPNSVREIGKNAFGGCSGITGNVIIPSGITRIESGTFGGCSSITSITIPSTVTEINRGSSFAGCGGELIVNCNIPDSYGNPGYKYNGVFQNSLFTKVTIGDGVTKIGDYAFTECRSIESITIPGSVTDIGEMAFSGCCGEVSVNCNISEKAFMESEFSKVIIGESVEKIDDYAFFDCNKIKSIIINGSILEIGYVAFKGCGGELTVNGDIPDGAFIRSLFTKVTIGEKVKKIGGSAFNWCSNIESIVIPSNVTEISEYAFEGCVGELTINCNIPDYSLSQSSFTKITVGDGVTKIGSGAFESCEKLTDVILPNSLMEIGNYAFFNCINLTSDIVIPNGVTKIGKGTFKSCYNLSSIVLPSGISEIGDHAFYNCYSIINTIILDNIKEIGEEAFVNYAGNVIINCDVPYAAFVRSNIKNVTIGDNVTKIGQVAFYECPIKSITIPDSVTKIEDYAFYGCYQLSSVYFTSATPPLLGNSIFDKISNNCKIYVPESYIDTYKTSLNVYLDKIVGYTDTAE